MKIRTGLLLAAAILILLVFSTPQASTQWKTTPAELRFCQLVKSISIDVAELRSFGRTKAETIAAFELDEGSETAGRLITMIVTIAYHNVIEINNELDARAFGQVIYNECMTPEGVQF